MKPLFTAGLAALLAWPACCLAQVQLGAPAEPSVAASGARRDQPPSMPGGDNPSSATANPILHVPVSGLRPGAIAPKVEFKNPLEGDKDAVTRGMRHFIQFNCVGCHAPNGGGGMGPSLSDARYIYGSSPANIFLSIYQGRPKGMPAWGETLPEKTIWELVSYVKNLQEKTSAFGKTTSRKPMQPAREMVPAEFLQTADPWNFTEPFSSGMKPNAK